MDTLEVLQCIKRCHKCGHEPDEQLVFHIVCTTRCQKLRTIKKRERLTKDSRLLIPSAGDAELIIQLSHLPAASSIRPCVHRFSPRCQFATYTRDRGKANEDFHKLLLVEPRMQSYWLSP